jgi:hypothetical protein
MKHTRQVKAQATPDVVFEQARLIAQNTEKVSGVEAKPNSYVRYVIENAGIGFDFTPADGGTMVACTATLKYGAGEAWSGGIFTPLIAPGLYLTLRRTTRKLTNSVKELAETEAVSARHKLKVHG